jgi:hypothetical protein
MTEGSNFAQLVNAYGQFLFYLLIIFPLIGGLVLWQGFRLTKVADFTFVKCWKIYLTALCYAYLLIYAAILIFGRPGEQAGKTFSIFLTLLFFLVPLVAIPLLVRNFNRRVVLVELMVILLANSLILISAFVMSLSRAQDPDKVPPPQSSRSAQP